MMKVDLEKSVVVNFKTYEQATGNNALALARVCDDVAKETSSNIVVAVQATDIKAIAESVDISVFAQHIDAVEYGSAKRTRNGDFAGATERAPPTGAWRSHMESEGPALSGPPPAATNHRPASLKRLRLQFGRIGVKMTFSLHCVLLREIEA